MKALFPPLRKAWPCLLTLALSAPALAQDPPPTPDEDVHEQMRKLIARIEQGFRRVDRLLWSADGRLGEGADTSISSRLAAARDRTQKVLDDIDALLEIRHHPHDGGSGGS